MESWEGSPQGQLTVIQREMGKAKNRSKSKDTQDWPKVQPWNVITHHLLSTEAIPGTPVDVGGMSMN